MIRLPVFIFLLLSRLASAQMKPVIDSLERRVKEASTVQEKSTAMNDLAQRLVDVDNVRAEQLAREALKLGDSIHFVKGRTGGMITLAIISKERGDYPQALQQLKDALAIAEEANDSSEVARSLFNIGDVFKALHSHERAASYFRLAYKMYSALNDKGYKAICVNKLAHTYLDKAESGQDTADYKLALKYYDQALEMAKVAGNKHRTTVAYVNLANCYTKLGRKTGNKEYFFHSLDLSMRGLKVAREDKDLVREGMNLTNIAEVYQELGQMQKALQFYLQALTQFEQSGNKFWQIYENGAIARLYLEMKDYRKALQHADLSMAMARKQNLKKLIADNYGILAGVHSGLGNYEKALEAHREADRYRDSVMNERNALSVIRLQTELESEKKDKEIALLQKNKEIAAEKYERQNIFRNFLIVAVILLLGLLALMVNRYRVKQKAAAEILRAKETAEHAKEVQEQFLANTSHEIRTPMNGIIGMTEQLRDTELTEEQLEYVSAIRESSNNLLVIINDLLDLSKIKAGKMAFEHIPFRLQDLIRSLVLSVQYRVAEKKLQLRTNIDPAIPAVLKGDPVRLNQVLLNLLGNAIKFTEHGEVELNISLKEDCDAGVELLFTIRDTGIGIPGDKLESIFESFTQVNATMTRKYGGTGLGLTIVKQIVDQQGGKVSVQSKVNEGSTFSLILSFSKTQQQPNKTLYDQDSGPAKRFFEDLHVLVVDDNRVNQRVASLTLRKWQIRVTVASDAAQAIEHIRRNKIDLVLMDLAMPEMDGIEATKYIREQLAFTPSRLPIVAMTASALIGEREKCLSAGMNDYISKPFNPADLFQLIARLFPDNLVEVPSATDLALLRRRAEGDNEYLQDILQSYITEMPEYLRELREFQSMGRKDKVAAQAHKMKSPAALIGAREFHLLLQAIEEKAGSGIVADLDTLVDKALVLGQSTVAELSEELLLLNSISGAGQKA